MNKEIKQMIEEEAENYKIGMLQRHTDIIDKFSDSVQYFTADDIKEARLLGCESILSKWQEAERWRKFSTDDLPKIGMRILLRVGERHDTTVICSHSHIHSLCEVFTEWKPIS